MVSGTPRVRKANGKWCLEPEDEALWETWAEAPAELDRLLEELFAAKPDDVLSWLHLAIWRLRTEELASKYARLFEKVPRSTSNADSSAKGSGSHRKAKNDVSDPFRSRLQDLPAGVLPLPQSDNGKIRHIAKEPACGMEDDGIMGGLGRWIKDRTFGPTEVPQAGFNRQISRDSNRSNRAHGQRRPSRDRGKEDTGENIPTELCLDDLKLEGIVEEGNENIPFEMSNATSSREDGWSPQLTELSDRASSHPAMPLDLQGIPHHQHDSQGQSSANVIRGMFSQQGSFPHSDQGGPASSFGPLDSAHSAVDSTHSAFNKYFGMQRRRDLGLSGPVTVVSHDSALSAFFQRGNCVLSPADRTRITWDCIFVFCLSYEFWSIPFEIIYVPDDSNLPDWFNKCAITSLIIFCIDIVLNFFTGYVDEGEIILDLKKIAVNYLRAWFWFDSVVTLPGVIIFVFGDDFFLARLLRGIKFYKLLKAVRLLRGLRMIRTQGFLSVIMRYFELQPMRVLVLQIFQLQLLIVCVAHSNACVWAFAQDESWLASTNDEAFEKYFESLYVAIKACTGGEDLPAARDIEQVVTIFACLQRVCCLILLIRWLLWRALLGAEEANHVGYQDSALAYLKHHKVSNTIQMKCYQTLKETGVKRWMQNFNKLSEQGAFPMTLRRLIAYELWCNRLETIDLIRKPALWNAEVLYTLAFAVREEVVASQVNIFAEGEACTIAFMVIQGVLASQEMVAAASPRGSQTMRRKSSMNEVQIPDYTAGMWVGEKALINPDLRHIQTIYCKASSHLMGVTAEAFHAVLEKFELKQQFEELLRQHLWNGMCGRCGTLGDHFSHDCKKTRSSRHASVVQHGSEIEDRNNIMQMISGENSTKGTPGLEAFLSRHGLSYILPELEKAGVNSVNDLTPEVIEDLRQAAVLDLTDDEWGILTGSAVKEYQRLVRQATTKVLTGPSADNHFIFISHYKFESGTEAALMKEDLVRLIMEDQSCPGHTIKSSVFLDTEELRDLNNLKEHVRKSHNLLLLLTPGVLTRPWCLIEIVVAIQAGVQVVPVEVQRRGISFEYPTEDYYERLAKEQELDAGAMALITAEDISLSDLEEALRKVFLRIALPFSPHKTANVRMAELKDILKNCQLSGDRRSSQMTRLSTNGSSMARRSSVSGQSSIRSRASKDFPTSEDEDSEDE